MSKLKEMWDDLQDGWIHKSMLQTYVTCPAKLRFMQLSIEEPEKVEKSDDSMKEFFVNKGSFFHDFAHYFSLNIKEFSEVIAEYYDKNLIINEELNNLKHEIIYQLIPSDQMEDKNSPFIHYYNLIDSFINFEVKRLVQLSKYEFDDMMKLWTPVAVEYGFKRKKQFHLPDNLQEIFGLSDVILKAKGTIDRLDRMDLDTIHLNLVEYKTGGWNSESKFKMTYVRRELAFYTIFNNPFGKYYTITHISCFNPEAPVGVAYMKEKLKTVTVNSMMKNLVKFKLAQESDDYDRPVCNPYLCCYCEYLDSCGKLFNKQWSEKDGYFQEAKDRRFINRKEINITY